MRNISADIFADEFFGSLSKAHRLLWLGLLLNIADDQGRMIDNVALIRSLIFPYDTDVTIKDIEKGLTIFVAKHKITRYVAGTNGSGKRLMQIVNWWKYQKSTQWAGRSQFAAPPKWHDRIRIHEKGGGIALVNWENDGGFVAATKPMRSGKVKVTKRHQRREREDEVKDEVKDSLLLREQTRKSFSEKIEKITPAIETTLSALAVPAGWIDEAIEIAVAKKKHRASYVIGILNNWKLEGRSNDTISKRNSQSADRPAPRGRQNSTSAATAAAAKRIIANRQKADV